MILYLWFLVLKMNIQLREVKIFFIILEIKLLFGKIKKVLWVNWIVVKMSCTEDFTNSDTVKVTIGAAGCGSVVEGLSATSAEVSSGAGTLVDCTTGGSISIISAWTIVVLIASVIAEVWSELEVSTVSSALIELCLKYFYFESI